MVIICVHNFCIFLVGFDINALKILYSLYLHIVMHLSLFFVLNKLLSNKLSYVYLIDAETSRKLYLLSAAVSNKHSQLCTELQKLFWAAPLAEWLRPLYKSLALYIAQSSA